MTAGLETCGLDLASILGDEQHSRQSQQLFDKILSDNLHLSAGHASINETFFIHGGSSYQSAPDERNLRTNSYEATKDVIHTGRRPIPSNGCSIESTTLRATKTGFTSDGYTIIVVLARLTPLWSISAVAVPLASRVLHLRPYRLAGRR